MCLRLLLWPAEGERGLGTAWVQGRALTGAAWVPLVPLPSTLSYRVPTTMTTGEADDGAGHWGQDGDQEDSPDP